MEDVGRITLPGELISSMSGHVKGSIDCWIENLAL
jgi:hypothetical protein